MSTSEAVPLAGAKEELDGFLRRIRRRWLAGQILRNLAIDGILGAALLVVVLVADRIAFPGLVTWGFVAIWIVAGLVASLGRSLCWGRIGRVEAAVLADSRLALKERVSSVEHLRSKSRPELEEICGLVESDAAQAIAGVPVAEKFPLVLPRFALWCLVPLAAGVAVAMWLPKFDLLGQGGRKEALAREARNIQEEKARLDDKLKDLAKKAAEKQFPETQKVLELLAQKLAAEPAKPEAKEGSEAQEARKANAEPRQEALVQMSRREEVIKQGLEEQKFKSLKDGLAALKKLDLKSAQLTKKLQDALKNGDFKEARDALGKLKEDLDKLTQKRPEELTPEEKARLDKLAEELSKLAKDSSALSKLSQSLNQASQQLGRQGLSAKDFQEGLESLEKAAEELQALSSLADEMEMLNQALELVELSREELAKLQSCPECGTPYCADCGKPQCDCKPSQKPGGT